MLTEGAGTRCRGTGGGVGGGSLEITSILFFGILVEIGLGSWGLSACCNTTPYELLHKTLAANGQKRCRNPKRLYDKSASLGDSRLRAAADTVRVRAQHINQ